MINAAPTVRPDEPHDTRTADTHWRAGWAAGLVVLAVATFGCACLPLFYLLFVASFQSLGALLGLPHWPATPGPLEWAMLLIDVFSHPFTRQLGGTLAASFMVVGVSLFLGVTAHYAFGRAPFRGRLGTLLVLGATLLPQVVLLSSMFEVARILHLYNHWWGLTMPYLTFTLPFAVWAVMVFTSRSPASPWRGIVRRRLWPTLSPAMSGTAIVAFIAAWNEFMFSLTFVLDGTQRSPPLSMALNFAPEQVGAAIAALAVLAVVGAATWRTGRRRRRIRAA